MTIKDNYDLIMISTCINHDHIYNLLESIKNNVLIKNLVILINQNNTEINFKNDDYNVIEVININSKVNSSIARNIGIEYIINNKIVSSFVCYPDDDSSFDKNYFIKLKDLILKDQITCYITDLYCSDKEGLFREVNLPNYTKLTKSNFNIVGAVNILVSFNVFQEIGFYDERFGVNALYGAGEDGDYYLRGLQYSEFLYTKDIFSFHPSGHDKLKELSYKNKRKKLNNYGKGVMALLNKHKMYKESLIMVFRAIGGVVFSFSKFQFTLGIAYFEAFFVRLVYLFIYFIKPIKYINTNFNSNI